MTSAMQREEWEELAQVLKEMQDKVPVAATDGDFSDAANSICRDLRGVQATAAMLDMPELESAVVYLEKCLQERIAPHADQRSWLAFQLAVAGLVQAMEHGAGNGGVEINLEQIQKALETGLAAAAGDHQSLEKQPEISKLQHLVTRLGGECCLESNGSGGTAVHLQFAATSENMEQLEECFSLKDATALLNSDFVLKDDRIRKVLNNVREFMQAMSSGDIKRSQEILLFLAEQQDQAGLYNEIGLMARELHNSLRHFMDTLDPSLKEIVESKIPDSGNRLEHILELTEKAANITLDHVEAIQNRNHEDQRRIAETRKLLKNLQPISAQAHTKLASGLQLSAELAASLRQTHEDLLTILTAQDYQDLTGQIIMKIMNLLNELELKLVNVIRIFGMKGDVSPEKPSEELYGPAYKGKAEALHSQDDVDALLAQFGF